MFSNLHANVIQNSIALSGFYCFVIGFRILGIFILSFTVNKMYMSIKHTFSSKKKVRMHQAFFKQVIKDRKS